jgi:hypothetical protein
MMAFRACAGAADRLSPVDKKVETPLPFWSHCNQRWLIVTLQFEELPSGSRVAARQEKRTPCR